MLALPAHEVSAAMKIAIAQIKPRLFSRFERKDGALKVGFDTLYSSAPDIQALDL